MGVIELDSAISTSQQSLPPIPESDGQFERMEMDRMWRDSIDRLLFLLNVGDDWDGEGASAPLPDLVKSVIELFKWDKFRKSAPGVPARIAPMHDGRIVLEWYFSGFYLNVRVDTPGRAKCLLVKPDKTSKFFPWNWIGEQG